MPKVIANELLIRGACLISTTIPKLIARIPLRVISHQFLNSLICM
jgi:hypothetical protein